MTRVGVAGLGGASQTGCRIEKSAQGGRMPSYVYLLASRPYGTLYIGVTSNIGQRAYQHKQKAFPGFSAKYGVHRLVWMEEYERIVDAISREKVIKKWRRAWKIALIEEMNPTWEDLFYKLNW